MPLIKSLSMLLLSLVFLMLGACASNTPLQAEQMANTGRQYTTVLKKVNHYALDHSLEFTAYLLPGLPRDDFTLQQFTEALQERAALISATSNYLDTQATYFAELAAFAKGDNSDGTAKSLRKLIETLNKAPELPGIPRVAKESVTGLAEHVSR